MACRSTRLPPCTPAAFRKVSSSPTNLHQISTGDPASLFHSKVSLLLDSHFPSGSLLFLLSSMTALPPSCLSPSEVEVVFRKLRGGKAPGFSVGFLRIIFSIDLSSASLGKPQLH
ncbi:hypothetical protein TNCV_105931 [Trichonephila clavipes]|nr:hypothetical protein TNCV_105931 [Trichonephila clavipes]